MEEKNLNRNLKYWWFPMLFGLFFIIVGIWILRSPKESMITLTRLVGALALVSGTTQIFFTLIHTKRIPGWGIQLVSGGLDLALGFLLVMKPEVLLNIITFFVGIWLIVNAVLFIIKATEARDAKRSLWSAEMGWGIFLLVLAVIIIWHPLFLGIPIAIWAGMAFVVLGVFRIVVAFRLRRHRLHTLHDRDQQE